MWFFRRIFALVSYKEVQAWVFIVINLAVLTIYGSEIWTNGRVTDEAGLPAFAGLVIVAVCTTVFTVSLIVPMAIIFNRTANERNDERDLRIHREGRSSAFWVMFLLGCFSLVAYVFHNIGDLLFHSILVSILLSQLTYAFSTAVKYRRTGTSLFSEVQD